MAENSITISQWLRNCPLPKLEARMLLQHQTSYTPAQLITRDQEVLGGQVLQNLSVWVERRLNGEPMAYILGVREFYGRMFAVCPDVLIPRPETEHLVEAVLARLPENGYVWDLGTGSGAIAVTVALERSDVSVRASDISERALVVAAQNAATLGAKVEFAHGSWFQTDRPSEKFGYDVIVSNPPYIEAGDRHLQQGDLRFEPQHALTDFSDGLSCIRILTEGAPDYLKPGGWLLIEHGFDQGEAGRAIFSQAGFQEVQTLSDLAGLDRVTVGRKV
ncbi:peptide chain release factor N(5)-glutamine methyltransferase [Neisseria arctica]|uniref:peptide chain release factor N(5)-glutamine methyltransferase n=1 Tax=Neisseria arctica TaxID=1470200 RepID=UPI00064AE1F8|nr:peptide chain release factor N(5)-glutamine methyltransferase [Neisseria arctica]UOO86429.1 peptide chain release factor N(5)-glutamine methyltransferase [Neisseria arctica]